jgi:hypothetical protein
MSVISKELLSEVLEEEVGSFEIKNNALIYTIKLCFGYKTINIYELAHKCKEWAWDNGYSITIKRYKDGYQCILDFEFTFNLSNSNKTGHIRNWTGIVNSNTEPEAIFNACQWIYNNRRKNEQSKEQ